MAESRLNVPNVLSAFRIVCVPVLLLLAWHGALALFLIGFALGLASDVLDGLLARRLGQVTDFGARLDQWGDFALWVSLPLAAWWLWPETITREAAYVVLALACMLMPTAIAYLKYRAVPGYHTWSVKLGSVAMGVSATLLLLFDVAWPFRVAALFQVVCAIDELGITWLFAECHHDVPTVFHALRMRREAAARSASSA
jgi:CDP-diacylglycerol--glycerol-3-phosphate 3-phosphatidyltransferase